MQLGFIKSVSPLCDQRYCNVCVRIKTDKSLFSDIGKVIFLHFMFNILFFSSSFFFSSLSMEYV